MKERIGWSIALILLLWVFLPAQVNISQPSPVNQTQLNGVAVSAGNGASGAGVQRVAIASDNTAFPVNAVESGTWTVQPGNTANTTAWLYQRAGSTLTVVSSTSATSVFTGTSTLRRIVIGTGVASGTIKLFDLASGSCTGTPSTNPRGTLTMPSTLNNPISVEIDGSFANGLCVLESSASFVATFVTN